MRNQHPALSWFTRPSLDLKQYSGMVISSKNCVEWLQDIIKHDTSTASGITSDTKIVLCETCDIQAEFRWFIVDRKVVSGSMYRHNGQLVSIRADEPDVVNEAQKFADGWLPHDNCVMDLALVGGNMKVIEFNCINASGFYNHDTTTIFKKLYEYYEGRNG